MAAGTACAVAIVTRRWLAPDAASDMIEPVCPVYRLDRSADLVNDLARIIDARAVTTLVVGGVSPILSCLPLLRARFPDLRIVSFQFNEFAGIGKAAMAKAEIDLFIAETRLAAGGLRAAGVPTDKIRIIPSGVNVATIAQRPRLPVSRPRVAFVGRFDRTKNPQGFVRMVHRLGDREADFLMIGTGRYALRARLLALRLGLLFRIHMIGLRSGEALEMLMDSIDILVVPSLRDGRPLVIQEARARGIAIVAHSVGGIADLIEHRVSGLLCDPADADALPQAVSELLDNPGLRTSLGREARIRAFADGELASRLPAYCAAIFGPRGSAPFIDGA